MWAVRTGNRVVPAVTQGQAREWLLVLEALREPASLVMRVGERWIPVVDMICHHCDTRIDGTPFIDAYQVHNTGTSEVWCSEACHDEQAEAYAERLVQP